MAQTSINIQPVKGGSEQHNKREKKLDYVREEFSCLNSYWEMESQSQRLQSIKDNYKSKTGQKMQAKATPIREAVVVIKEDTTMEDMQRLAAAYKERFGIETFQIAIHKDEGHHKGKVWKPNLHAHLVFDWTDHQTGKSIKLNRADMVEMQTITADVLGMERGVSSDKKHLTALQWKNKREEEQKILLETETERLKVGKARKEAAIETAKSVSEGVKSLLGISAKEKEINALRNEINRQKQEIKQIAIDAQKKIDEQEKNWKQKVQSIANDRDRAQESVQEERKHTGLFVKLLNNINHVLDPIISLATDRSRISYSEEEICALDKTLGKTSVENRIQWAKLYVLSTFRHLLSKDFQDRFRDVSIETERVARYKTQHQLKQQGQNQPEQRSRGVRR